VIVRANPGSANIRVTMVDLNNTFDMGLQQTTSVILCYTDFGVWDIIASHKI